ncbi:MAG: beta-ketoacyl-ACP synthase II [Oscillospiraceae bacterium]|nr:beta-ketoacyl-ACP synthase II [Oscillospiraceae bacterium]MDD4368528.1 beta-ketoacyl-ACP synthase II [Oscillospiraceae bacterium]
MTLVKQPTAAPPRRVVVTGIGAITPLGLSMPATWQELLAGHHGIARLEGFDTADYRAYVAAQVKGFNPVDYMDKREARRLDRFSLFALAAAQEACRQASYRTADWDPYRVGVIIGTGIGGIQTFQQECVKLAQTGPRMISPLFIPMMIGNIAAGKVGIELGIKGATLDITTACTSGTNAIGEAFRKIKYGELDCCITGGTEAPICEIAVAGFGNMKALTPSRDPDRASIPFDRERSGFVIGEGAGILILEELAAARRRGAPILAEVAGYGTTGDAYHITSPAPDGAAAARAMTEAMTEAGVQPEEVDYINAHGTSTPLNDKYETLAIHAALGEACRKTAVSSTKGALGHLLGASGAVEACILVNTVREGIIPPTVGYREPDPDCDLDYVTEGCRHQPVRLALSNSFGFGGHNGCLAVKAYQPEEAGA